MRAIAHLLEDFSAPPVPDGGHHHLTDGALEDIRLAAFEQGYAAGWEDAAKAQGEDQARLSAALASNLEDLSFTYQEAVAHLTLAIEPVFRALLDSALPALMQAGFGDIVLAELQQMAQAGLDQPVVIAVPPGAAAAIRPLLAERLAMAVELLEDPALGPGQADLRIGRRACQLDCRHLTDRLQQAARAFFHQAATEVAHG